MKPKPKTMTEKVKEVFKKEEPKEKVADLMNPPFDPDIPEQKQRWLR